jgi:hypothetical protein
MAVLFHRCRSIPSPFWALGKPNSHTLCALNRLDYPRCKLFAMRKAC